MQKRLAFVWIAVFVLSAAPVLTVQGAQSGGEWTGVADPGRGSGFSSQAVPMGTSECSGAAPFDYWCASTSEADGGSPPGAGCVAGVGYTGTIESILHWSNGQRWVLCTFVNGSLMHVVAGGTFPGPGDEVRLECWSYQEGTAGLLPTPNGLGTVLTAGPLQGDQQAETDPQGIPGGDGPWGCA